MLSKDFLKYLRIPNQNKLKTKVPNSSYINLNQLIELKAVIKI